MLIELKNLVEILLTRLGYWDANQFFMYAYGAQNGFITIKSLKFIALSKINPDPAYAYINDENFTKRE